jgi:hypothetical protein
MAEILQLRQKRRRGSRALLGWLHSDQIAEAKDGAGSRIPERWACMTRRQIPEQVHLCCHAAHPRDLWEQAEEG